MLIHAETQPVLAVDTAQPGNHNTCTASGVDQATSTAYVIAEGAYHGPNCTSVLIPPHRRRSQTELPA